MPNFALWTLVKLDFLMFEFLALRKIKFYVHLLHMFESVVSDYSDNHKDNTSAAYVRNSISATIKTHTELDWNQLFEAGTQRAHVKITITVKMVRPSK